MVRSQILSGLRKGLTVANRKGDLVGNWANGLHVFGDKNSLDSTSLKSFHHYWRELATLMVFN